MQWFSVVLAISISPLLIVSTDKSVIITEITRESWLSMENFTSLLKVSFDTSICCNVFIPSDTFAIENFFNEFVRLYPYEYTLNVRTYACSGYLIIYTSTEDLINAMITVPTTIASIQLLLIVNDNVEESSSQFNISLYRNANVNIAARNGLWCLSENFLEPRTFKEISGFREMSRKRGFVNFQGRELTAVTFYIPPFCYLRSTVNLTHKGVETTFFIEDNESVLDGIEIQIFLMLASRLNFTWKIRQGDLITWYGNINGSTWNGGIIGQILQNEVDIAFADIWLVWDSYIFSNLTQPWNQGYLKFLVPKPRLSKNFLALITPLSKEVWAAIFTMLVVQSIYVFTRAWVDPRIPTRLRNFVVTFTELMGQLLGVWSPVVVKGLRFQFYLWHLIGILLVCAYSSNLAARLATTVYENKIDTFRDFVESNLTWGIPETLSDFDVLFEGSDPYLNQLPELFVYEGSVADRHTNILKGNYAILGNVIDAFYIPTNYINDEDLKLIYLLIRRIVVKGYRVMNEAIASFFISFCVQPWLVGPFDKVLFQLRESGVVQYHIDHVLHRRTTSAVREVMIEDDKEGPQVLTLTSLGLGFTILILGLTLSTFTFFLELKFFIKKRSNNSNLVVGEIIKIKNRGVSENSRKK